jgi:peptidoglycan/xylan/chitin deacetylase (PgdA/CDA1 family)
VPGITERILDLLGESDVRATFFVQGRWVEAYPDVAARIHPEGHLVGNHSHYHARMPLLSATGFATDVRAAQRVIEDRLGVDPRPWFRCPFGAGAGRPKIQQRLQAVGYRDVGWDVDSRDWAAQSPRRLATFVVRKTLEHGDGAVLLFHGWPKVTPLALREVIGRLREAGAEFVPVDELPSVPAPTVESVAGEAALDEVGAEAQAAETPAGDWVRPEATETTAARS